MESKEAQTVARQAATPTAPKDGAGSEAPVSAQTGNQGRRADEITLRVQNPLLVQKAPPPPDPAPVKLDPASPHTSPTAKLKVSSLVWNEYNSMPLTPAPMSLSKDPMLSESPGITERPKKLRSRMIVLVVVIIAAGVIAGAFIPRSKTGPQVAPLPEPEPKTPAAEAPEKSLEVPKSPTLAGAKMPAPTRLSKRHVSIKVDPAEATLALDGAVQNGHAIALDLVQDKTSHVVQASAHGYLPFKKSFTLEGDVDLHISLKRAASPVFRGRPMNQPSEPIAVQPESEIKAKTVTEPSEDFGMDLKRPASRPQSSKMEDKDPYAP
jgi:hypothetical protein